MRKFLPFPLFAAALLLLTACPAIEPEPEPVKPEPVVKYSVKSLDQMTLREKVGQMFFIRVNALSIQDNIDYASNCTKLTAGMTENYEACPVGGVVLFASNITNPDQLILFNSQLHTLPNYPLICVDEEGGTVARVGRNSNFHVVTYSSMGDVGATGDETKAYEAGSNIGAYLYVYGFDVDFAPVADVNSNPNNTVIGKRAFSSDPKVAAAMSSQFLLGLRNQKIEGCLKHFPGHGDTNEDSHYGYAETGKSWEEMLQCEMIPFKKGIENRTGFIMTAHISAPKVTGTKEPSTMSRTMLQDKLRGELGYRGIIITDALGMNAISKEYGNDEAAVNTILAGADIALMPLNCYTAYNAVIRAVQEGRISESRIDSSVTRILEMKKKILKQKGLLAE